MIAQTTIVGGESILGLLGIYPALLALVAVLIGVSTVIVRKNRYNTFAAIVIASVGCFGLGATAWRLYGFNGMLRLGGVADPSQWMRTFGTAWMAAGVVLPACGIGLLLLGISSILTKPAQNTKRQNKPEMATPRKPSDQISAFHRRAIPLTFV